MALVALTAVLGTGFAAAAGVVGPEARVNAGVEGEQQSPAAAADASGGFVVAWRTGDDGNSVAARRLDAAGRPRGAEIPVHVSASIGGFFPALPPAVAADAAGGFAVAWIDRQVLARRYSPAGEPIGPAVAVSPGALAVDVASAADGSFVVVWDFGGRILARRHAASGTPLGDAFPVTPSTFRQSRPAVASTPEGGFVVVWQSSEQDSPCPAPDGDCSGEEYGVFARRFAASGAPLGDELAVNVHVLGNQQEPDVAAGADGGFLVVWESFAQDGIGWGVYGRRFDAAGAPAGGEERIDSVPGGQSPSVAAGPGGGFTVAFAAFRRVEPPQSFGDIDVLVREVGADGRPGAPEREANAFLPGDQFAADVAVGPTGRGLVVWQSNGQDGDRSGIFARRLAPGRAGAASDFDGDGASDPATFAESSGRWLLDLDFAAPAEVALVYGRGGDLPVPKDYDGDGRTDLAVFRPAGATWFVDSTLDGGSDLRVPYGRTGDVPVPADYDGDGRADLAVFRAGRWFVDLDRNGGTDLQRTFGAAGDVPLPGDYDGDGLADLATFRAGRWRVDHDRDGVADLDVVYGRAGDVPVPGDYDGDGRVDLAVFRPEGARWFVDVTHEGGTDATAFYGLGTDVPVAGDYDGDGRFDFAVYRPSSGRWFADTDRSGASEKMAFVGAPGETPLRDNGWVIDALGLTP